MNQSYESISKEYFRVYFADYLASVGGLFLSLLGIFTWLMSSYQEFVQQKSMLKRLYGEVDGVPSEFKLIGDDEISPLERPVTVM